VRKKDTRGLPRFTFIHIQRQQVTGGPITLASAQHQATPAPASWCGRPILILPEERGAAQLGGRAKARAVRAGHVARPSGRRRPFWPKPLLTSEGEGL